ncbi:hypothetical protein BDR22DRAFT_348310 [Usnea florida]
MPIDRLSLAEISNVPRATVSPPFLTKLSRENREHIYDFVWDLCMGILILSRDSEVPREGKRNGLLSYEFPRERLRNELLSNEVPKESMLALLRVNRHIFAEAAPIFYGKRRFIFGVEQLAQFMKCIGRHCHLIRDVEVMHTLPDFLCPCDTLDTLLILSSLRSFTIEVNRPSMRLIERHLTGLGVHLLTEYMDVTVVSRRPVKLSWEHVEFTKTWTCSRGETKWRDKGFHCRVLSRKNEKGKWENSKKASQPCNHDHHHRGQSWDTDGFLSTSTGFLATYMELIPRGRACPAGYYLKGDVLVPIPDTSSQYSNVIPSVWARSQL